MTMRPPFPPVRLLGVLACAALGTALRGAPERAPYLDPALPVEARIDDLLPRLTLEEKVALVHANGMFRSGGVPRLGIPYLWMDDGPQGVREEIGLDSWTPAGRTDDFATALPPGIAIAATWDPEIAQACGAVIGEEARARGKDVMLGPAMNIMRTPLCGRNYDYYGEDPWLAGRIAVGYVRGMQARADDRVREALRPQQPGEGPRHGRRRGRRADASGDLPARVRGVREGGRRPRDHGGLQQVPGGVLQPERLPAEPGPEGRVGIQGGGHLGLGRHPRHPRGRPEGPRPGDGDAGGPHEKNFLADAFLEGVKSGAYPVAILDDKVRRNLRLIFASGSVDGRRPGTINTPAHLAVVQHADEESMVLLKNEGALLPIDTAKFHSIAVIGENAVRKFAAGGNSAGVKAFLEVTALQGIVDRAGNDVNVVYSEGYRQPVSRHGSEADVAGVRTSELTAASPEESRELADRAVLAAKQCDVAIVIAGLSHQAHADDEGTDRYDLSLPAHQAELIARVAAANPRTVVVLIDGSPVDMAPWLGAGPGRPRGVVRRIGGGQRARGRPLRRRDSLRKASLHLPQGARRHPDRPGRRARVPGRRPRGPLRRGAPRRLPLVRLEEDRAPVPVRVRTQLHDVRVLQPEGERGGPGRGDRRVRHHERGDEGRRRGRPALRPRRPRERPEAGAGAQGVLPRGPRPRGDEDGDHSLWARARSPTTPRTSAPGRPRPEASTSSLGSSSRDIRLRGAYSLASALTAN